jgi:enamine deaminase RidA (YjgF/YER057c/UK114 family)
LIEGSIADKTKQCCDNIVAILAEVNVGVERIVKVRFVTFPSLMLKATP